MSWSVTATNVTPEAAEQIEAQFAASGPCMDPEEGVRQSARATIATALAAQSPGTRVQVSAYGSQSIRYGADNKAEGFTNSLKISIDVLL
jgi:hypothetical protein